MNAFPVLLASWTHVIVGLVAALLLVTAAVFGPLVLAAANPRWVRVGSRGGPDSVLGGALGEELRGMGFMPLGIKSERAPLTWAVETPVFASTEHGCFADLQYSVCPYAGFMTAFADGRSVYTAATDLPRIEAEEGRVTPVASPADLRALLQTHQAEVALLVGAAPPALLPLSLEGRVAATRAFYRTGPGRKLLRRQFLRRILEILGSVS